MTALNESKMPVPKRAPTPSSLSAIERAALAVTREQWSEAITLATEASGLDPKSFEAWVLGGVAHARLKNLRDATLCFQRALEQRPNDVQAWVDLGECCLGMNDWGRAGRALGRAIELDPRSEHPAGRRARALAGRAIIRLRAGK